MTHSCRIDFTQPLTAGAARLRHRFEAPREVLVAHALQEVRSVLDAVFAAYTFRLWRNYSDDLARRTFRWSIIYLTLIFAALVADHFL